MQILIYCLNRPFSAGVGFDFNCFFFSSSSSDRICYTYDRFVSGILTNNIK